MLPRSESIGLGYITPFKISALIIRWPTDVGRGGVSGVGFRQQIYTVDIDNTYTYTYTYIDNTKRRTGGLPFIAAYGDAETQCISESSHESCDVNKLVWSKCVDNSKRPNHLYQSTGTPKRTEQNLFVCIGKFEAEVINIKRLRSTYCTANSKDIGLRSARPAYDSRASCQHNIYTVAVDVWQSAGCMWIRGKWNAFDVT